MGTHFRTIAALLTALLIAGCGLLEGKKEAQKVADDLYTLIDRGERQTILELYSDEFYEVTTREEWSRLLETVALKLGSYQQHELISWQTKSLVGTGGVGTLAVFVYRVQYSKYDATETLTLFKSIGDSSFRIMGHQIKSDGFALDRTEKI
jgi:hypothetical protein